MEKKLIHQRNGKLDRMEKLDKIENSSKLKIHPKIENHLDWKLDRIENWTKKPRQIYWSLVQHSNYKNNFYDFFILKRNNLSNWFSERLIFNPDWKVEKIILNSNRRKIHDFILAAKQSGLLKFCVIPTVQCRSPSIWRLFLLFFSLQNAIL